MGGRCWLAGGPRAAISSRSATREPFVTPNSSSSGRYLFPKSARLLKSGDFRNVYDDGFRVPGRYFVAFCLRRGEGEGAKVGFTTPRALGRAVVRNRIRRRMREAVRLQLPKLPPGWWVVFNPRRVVLTAPFSELQEEVARVFRRCSEPS